MNWNIMESGFYNSGMSGMGAEYQNLLQAARNFENNLSKAYTTGESIVLPTNSSTADTGARNLRMQFLRDALEQVSFDQEDAKMMKRISKPRASSNTYEWSALKQYGGAGDGFTPETGTDGAFNVSSTDDVFARMLRQIKYLAAVREIGVVSQLVNNVKDPETVAEQAATLELVGKCNLALYFGDSKKSAPQFDGFERQLIDWITPTSAGGYGNTEDQDILFDAGGAPIDMDMIVEIAKTCAIKFGDPGLLMMSAQAYMDAQRVLYPFQRTDMGSSANAVGLDRNKAITPFGNIELDFDKMLRANRPLVADGPGVTGKPKTTADSGALALATDALGNAQAFSATPASCVGVAAGSAGTGSWWLNGATNGGNVSTSPAVPSGVGNQGNRLAAGSYYYAVSAVLDGKESLPHYFDTGAGAGSLAAADATAVTAGQIVSVAIDNTKVTGITSSNYTRIKFRIYRATAANSVNDFDLVAEIGCTGDTGLSVYYDNGKDMPGKDTAYLFTKKKNGVDAFMLLQLLPIIKRTGLPAKVLSDPLALLLFCAPILLVPRHHIQIRNIGRPG